jgi:DNA primase
MSEWIDFRELRAKLRFAEVLAHYRVKLNVKSERATGFCPLPIHQGKRNSPSFSANLERGIWQCFGCGAKGNVLDFACRMEGFNPGDPKELRKAAVKIHATFLGGVGTAKSIRRAAPAKAATKNAVVNPPLDFDLKDLDFMHPYLRSRGFTDETIRHFGLGYCKRGMLKGRIAIPLHDHQGQLIGYSRCRRERGRRSPPTD